MIFIVKCNLQEVIMEIVIILLVLAAGWVFWNQWKKMSADKPRTGRRSGGGGDDGIGEGEA